jgi:parallel beta-helix repeat protein
MKNKKQGKLNLLNSSIQFLSFIIFALLLIPACKKDTEPVSTNENAQAQSDEQLTTKWGAPNIIVHKGESIQAAVNKAKNGNTIFIEPGIYKEAIVVDKPGIKLIGKISINGDEVVIKNPGDEDNGIKVTGNGDGFVLANITVRDFEENGVFLDSADNYVITHVKAINNKDYGIFPVHSNHGLIEFCIATGSSDTGIYVGQSSDVVIQFNTAFANVQGVEVENSSNVDVAFNQSYNNVSGLSVTLLPGKDITTSSNVHVHQNHFYNNNHVNFGDADELEANIPVGIGVLILGTDQTVVENNTITGNDFSGVIVFSSLVLTVIADVPPSDFEGMEPNPDGVKVIKNLLKNNGSNPPEIPDLPLPGVDLLWDGSGTDNCWSKNIFTTSYPSPLPSCN